MSKIIADIGATNARFALVEGDGRLAHIEVLACDAFPSPADAARAYLAKNGGKPVMGVFAVATPQTGGDTIEMTNHVWKFSVQETAAALNLSSLKIINDFTAIAYAVPYLHEKDVYKIGNGSAQKNLPIAIVGPGTGLGVSAVIFVDGKPHPVTTEGGHVTMPATTPREYALFEYLRKTKYHHVSAERVIAGKGLVNVYHAIGGVDGISLPEKSPADITEAALKNTCVACEETLDLFCHFLGVIAGNAALTYGALGGVYIAGGIVPQLGDYFKNSRFRDSFLAKGRYRDYMDRIPTFVITHPYPGLEGLKQPI